LKRIIPSLTIFVLFLIVFLYLVPLQDIVSALRKIEPSDLLLGFLAYTLSQILRALRWKLLLKNLSLKDTFLINSANILLNNVLPARTGELSWFYYARRLGVDLKSSLWSFFLGRLYDLLALLSLLFLAYSLLRDLLLPALLLLFLLSLTPPYLRELLPPLGKLSEIKDFLRKELTPSLSLKLSLLSTLSFFFKVLGVYIVVRELVGANLFTFAFAFTGGELTTILPVHGFMGYGTYEAGFSIPLKVAGLSLSQALKVGFLAHSFLLLSSALWGSLAILLLHTPSRKSP